MVNGITLSISEFAELSRTTRDTLRHYDRIGLLSPMSRGENNYRYYCSSQLAVINVIRTLQVTGMTLEEIKKLKDIRTPELADEVFTQQIDKIDAVIDEWIQAKKLVLTLQKNIHSVKEISTEEITVQFMQAEAIVLGESNDYSKGQNDYDALLCFYKSIHQKYPDYNLNYSVWGVFSQNRIKNLDWVWPDRYYFNNPEGHDLKPAALYAIGYKRGGYGQNDDLYKRILSYIDANGYEICGDAYEEYPLNEVCVIDDTDYMMRVMISVRKKG